MAANSFTPDVAITVNLARFLGSSARKQANRPTSAQVQPIAACLRVIPPPPFISPPEMKSKKNLFAEESKEIAPCKIVAIKEIAAMLNPTVAAAGRRLKSFWNEELLIRLPQFALTVSPEVFQ